MHRHDHPVLSAFSQALSPPVSFALPCGAARRPVRRHGGHGVALWLAVLAGALLTAPQAFAQAQGAGAMFDGRPAMAGAQGGQGAQAGMPQGGLGVQGNEGQKGLVLREPDKGLASERRSALAEDRRAARKAARRARAAAAKAAAAAPVKAAP